ncbi:DUF3795 domain-containing protein [Anaerolentibacter hominis]|uniref:DUF3795 domain-containing protein n=1 Tax=Anaerolentibacter hominis TaxID=3079009 RepID=UPI0031B88360
MFESRCGICCSQCTGKDEVHCDGCLNMEVPFWGSECAVKSCCEEKKLNHCGECADFPCDMLATMGVEEGYDPEPKLKQLRIWASENN